MCKITVIIPVYNAEKSLAQCLDSLLRQTFQDFEVILINDGSEDRSLEILEDYCQKDGRFQLYSQENKGPSAARNVGLDRAGGDYLYFVDSDDYIEDHALESLFEAASSSKAEMTICGFNYAKDKLVVQHPFAYPPGLYEGQACRKMALDLLTNHSAQLIPPYSVIRFIDRTFLERQGLRFEEGIRRSEDYLFTTEVHFAAQRVTLITDQALYNYIDSPGSITKSYVEGYWQMVKDIYQRLDQKLPASREVKSGLDAMLIYRSLIALNNLSRVDDKDTFRAGVRGILKDPLFLDALDSLSWKDGYGRFGPYYLLARLRLRKLIGLRYHVKYQQAKG